jgi:hypothetical protein
MRETLDHRSTSDRTWRFMVWSGPPRDAPGFWRAVVLQSDDGYVDQIEADASELLKDQLALNPPTAGRDVWIYD